MRFDVFPDQPSFDIGHVGVDKACFELEVFNLMVAQRQARHISTEQPMESAPARMVADPVDGRAMKLRYASAKSPLFGGQPNVDRNGNGLLRNYIHTSGVRQTATLLPTNRLREFELHRDPNCERPRV